MSRPLPETPLVTADVIVELPGRGIVLVKRKNPPPGWAIPGGFVERGESCEDAAAREIREETGLRVENLKLLGVYSDPSRDPRFYTCTAVYTAIAGGEPVAADDAAEVGVFTRADVPADLAFDHRRILGVFFDSRADASGVDRRRSYGIIIVDDAQPRRYLLLKRRGRDAWELPKGKAEPGESPEQAARREVLEETGLARLELEPHLVLQGRYDRGDHRGHKELHYFLSRLTTERVKGPVVLSHEHDDWGWFDPAEAAERFQRDVYRRILRSAERYLRGDSDTAC